MMLKTLSRASEFIRYCFVYLSVGGSYRRPEAWLPGRAAGGGGSRGRHRPFAIPDLEENEQGDTSDSTGATLRQSAGGKFSLGQPSSARGGLCSPGLVPRRLSASEAAMRRRLRGEG